MIGHIRKIKLYFLAKDTLPDKAGYGEAFCTMQSEK